MIGALISLLALAGAPNAQAKATLFDDMIGAKKCRTGSELGLDPRFGSAQRMYCRFDLPYLRIEVTAVGEAGASATVEEIDHRTIEHVMFVPFQACLAVMPTDTGRGVAVVHTVTAKVFKTRAECEAAK